MADVDWSPAGTGQRSTTRRHLARACVVLIVATLCLRVEGQGTLVYKAVVPNAGDLTTFLVNQITVANVSSAAMTPQINALGTNHATYQANPTSENLHHVLTGIVDYMANPEHLGDIRQLELKNPSYALVQQQMAVRRKQQCADLLNSQRKLGTTSQLPQAAIDCVCNKRGDNIPYYVCNARYHQFVAPAVMDYPAAGAGNNANGGLVDVSGFLVLPFSQRELRLDLFNVTNPGKTTQDPVSAGQFAPISTGSNAAALTGLGSILGSNFTGGNSSLPANMTGTGVVLGGLTMAQLMASINLNQSDTLAITSNKVLETSAPPAVGGGSPPLCGDLFKNAVNLFANLLQNKAPVAFSCGTQFPIAEYPAFVRVALTVNLPGINFVPFTGTGSGSPKQPFALEICEANAGGCTTFCPPGTPASGGSCGSGKYIESKVVEAVAQSNINLDIAVCLGYTGSDPVTKQLYDTVSIILRLLGLDPCPIHGGVTIFPFVLIADGYLQIGIAFVDIRADVEVKFAPDNGFSTQICDYLKTGYDVDPNPAFLQVQCRPWCYQKFGEGVFKVAAELHILWFAWSWTLFQTNFGGNSQPILCQHPPVGVYGPAKGRNDTLFGPANIPMGTELISANGNFLLRFGSDGNVALYDSQQAGTFPDVQPSDSILWQTSTGGTGAIYQLFEGGNFQVQAPSGTSIWATGTDNYVLGKPYITVTNDGRVVFRDTYNNACYYDTGNQCKDGVAYWPAGFSDSIIETTNSSDPNYKPTCISNNTMLVSKNRLYSLHGNLDYWYVQGKGQVQRTRIQETNVPYSLTRTVTCQQQYGKIGQLCISAKKGDYPAYITNDPTADPEPTYVAWSVQEAKNAADLEGPLHMTLGDDGELGMWDYNGKQIFSYRPGEGEPDNNIQYARWIGLGQGYCAGFTVGYDAGTPIGGGGR
ncbi:hypothetical protein WJX72_010813 [[Myrmecia] bisecta]|uniref:Bulb-type lectin domain-containing protein n=1 Tax=[Myrmecia] bisecta TaxID=41462 RepID=A0AAW1PC52_9CHLO